MSEHYPQLLAQGKNPIHYMELIDDISSEGHQIREHVIFPALFSLLRETLRDSHVPVIDIGSGTGSLTNRLSNRLGLQIEGIDTSVSFLRLARATFPHMRFHMSNHSLSVGRGLYHAHMHLTLHCAPQPQELLESMTDAMEPNAYAFITIPHPDYFKVETVRQYPGQDAYAIEVGDKVQMTYYPLSLVDHEQAFTEAGLKIITKRLCRAPATAPAILDKYKRDPRFVIYVLQKVEDVIDAGLVMHTGSGKVLLLTRAATDDKFPGAKSLFSIRRTSKDQRGIDNLAQGMQVRLGLRPEYISPYILGSMRVKHRHAAKVQYAKVNLYAVKAGGPMPHAHTAYYADAQLIPPEKLQPSGGACTQLAYNFLHDVS